MIYTALRAAMICQACGLDKFEPYSLRGASAWRLVLRTTLVCDEPPRGASGARLACASTDSLALAYLRLSAQRFKALFVFGR